MPSQALRNLSVDLPHYQFWYSRKSIDKTLQVFALHIKVFVIHAIYCFHLGKKWRNFFFIISYENLSRNSTISSCSRPFFHLCRVPLHLPELTVHVYRYYKHYYKHFRRGTVFSYFYCEKKAKLLDVKWYINEKIN